MRKRFYILICVSILLGITSTGLCRQKTYEYIKHLNPPYIPWFTGSILPPSAINAKPGHPILAPYVALTVTYGRYDGNWRLKGTENTWAINPFVEYLFGLNDYIGVDIYTSFISNFKKGRHSTHLQDTIVRLGFQIANDIPKTWVPDIRITFQEIFPTGNYSVLNLKFPLYAHL